MNKVKGTENPADMNTKGFSGEEIAKYVEMLNMKYQEGRSELAPEVDQILPKQSCIRFNSKSSKITHRVKTKESHQKKIQQCEVRNIHNTDGEQRNCQCRCNDCWMYCESNPRS